MVNVQILFVIYSGIVSKTPNPGALSPIYCNMVTVAAQNAVNDAGGSTPSITISDSLMGGDPDFGEQKSFSAIYLNSSGVFNSLTVLEDGVATFS
jgi:hypothetical protein